MKFELWQIEKTKNKGLEEAIQKLTRRIRSFHPFSIKTIKSPGAKKMTAGIVKKKEGELLLSMLTPTDYLILLDEEGTMMHSRAFARQIERWRDLPTKRGIFVIGGAYGFSEEVYERANYKLSLSPMTFTHQLIRIIFIEQIYRAFTIIHNLPYHND